MPKVMERCSKISFLGTRKSRRKTVKMINMIVMVNMVNMSPFGADRGLTSSRQRRGLREFTRKLPQITCGVKVGQGEAGGLRPNAPLCILGGCAPQTL